MIEQSTQFGGGTASLVLAGVAAILGLAVGYLALRGYRRNETLAMLFVAAGFVLTFWAPALLMAGSLALGTGVTFAPGTEQRLATAVSLATEVVRIVGLLCILYGLWMPSREDVRGDPGGPR